MVILSIDPGTDMSAYTAQETDYKILDKGLIRNEKMIEIVQEASYDVLVCEGFQSFGMPVGREVFDTAYLIGRLWQIALDQEHGFQLVYRRDIKLHHCGSARAKDANIRQAMIDRYGIQGSKNHQGPLYGFKADMFSSLAISTYWIDTYIETATLS